MRDCFTEGEDKRVVLAIKAHGLVWRPNLPDNANRFGVGVSPIGRLPPSEHFRVFPWLPQAIALPVTDHSGWGQGSPPTPSTGSRPDSGQSLGWLGPTLAKPLLSVLASRTCADVGGSVRQVDNAEVWSSPISGPRREPINERLA